MSNTDLTNTLISVLERLETLMTLKSEGFRARAYQKAKESIILYNKPITSVSEIASLRNIGKTIIAKFEYYLEHGTLQIFEKAKNDPVYMFANIYGIGGKKAKSLVNEHGITTIEQLRENQQLLNNVQKIGLKYYEQLLERIPRAEIVAHEEILKTVFDSIDNNTSTFEIVGSYRRGKQTSGDIDVIICDSNNSNEVFNEFINSLIEINYVIEILSKGKVKSLAISQLKGYPARRIDFMFTPKEEFPFAILYFTGSKEFNTVMRQQALNMGYSMNEHGFTDLKTKKKLNFNLSTEKDVFKFLNIEYKHPTERIDGTSVVITMAAATKTTNNAFPVTKMIALFKKKGKPLLEKCGEAILSKMLIHANKSYYILNKPVMTDNQYDILREYTLQKFPENEYAQKGHSGVAIEAIKNKVKLPVFMPSMDKIKPDTTALGNWMKKYKGDYIMSCKLDGISALYCTPTEDDDSYRLYTRGNGEWGQDISYMIDYLKLPNTPGLIIRGELIMDKTTFDTKYREYFKNIRNLVAGLINRKKISTEILNDVDFVAYEVISPVESTRKQFAMLNTFQKNDEIIAVQNWRTTNITNEYLSNKLVEIRDNYEYDIDGVIVVNDGIYKRTKKNPKHGFAFKMVLSDQIQEAKVVAVHWRASKDGFLKPRVEIEPIIIGGVEITYVTAHNAAFIVNNNINLGAVIKMIRSGDVIPKIVEVSQQSDSPALPDEKLDYDWNETNVDFVLNNLDENESVKKQKILAFFTKMGVVGLGTGNTQKLINAGYDNIIDILKMTKEDYMELDGFKEKMATKVHNSMQGILRTIPLPDLMAATNIFGRTIGSRRIVKILEECPTIFDMTISEEDKVTEIAAIPTFGTKTAKMFVPYISTFLEFITEAKLEYKLNDFYNHKNQNPKSTEPQKFTGKAFIFSGFRSKDLKAKIEAFGGKISSSVSKKTTAVIVKDLDDDSSKIMKAKQLGVPIVEVNAFIEKFVLK